MPTQKTSCHHQPRCPGCPRYGQEGISTAARDGLHDLAQRWNHAEPEVIDCSAFGYRQRVRLSVRGQPGNLKIGIYEARSHRLVHIPDCPLHHPSIEQFIQRLLELDKQYPIDVYKEKDHTGLLRALQLAVEPKSGKVQAVFLVRDPLQPDHLVGRKLHDVLSKLSKVEITHSLFLGALPNPDNSLFPESLETVFGPEEFMDTSGGADVYYPPSAFGQANRNLHAHAVARIHQEIEGGSITEYYCGVGTIGLGLLAQGRALTFNELGAGSLRGLKLGLAQEEARQPSPRILVGAAGIHADAYDANATVIVDPPRKGLDLALLERLLVEPPNRLIYLSCGLKSLLRESELFHANGKLNLVHLSAYNYFPYTNHVETLAIWERSSAQAAC